MKSILLPLILLSTYSFGIVSELAFGKSTDIIGKPKITDGDTLVINDIRDLLEATHLKAIFLVKPRLVQTLRVKNGNVEKQQRKSLSN